VAADIREGQMEAFWLSHDYLFIAESSFKQSAALTVVLPILFLIFLTISQLILSGRRHGLIWVWTIVVSCCRNVQFLIDY